MKYVYVKNHEMFVVEKIHCMVRIDTNPIYTELYGRGVWKLPPAEFNVNEIYAHGYSLMLDGQKLIKISEGDIEEYKWGEFDISSEELNPYIYQMDKYNKSNTLYWRPCDQRLMAADGYDMTAIKTSKITKYLCSDIILPSWAKSIDYDKIIYTNKNTYFFNTKENYVYCSSYTLELDYYTLLWSYMSNSVTELPVADIIDLPRGFLDLQDIAMYENMEKSIEITFQTRQFILHQKGFGIDIYSIIPRKGY